MARFPVERSDGTIGVATHGRFGSRRSRPGEGQCRRGYPCTHWAVDLTAPQGTPVVAPEDGLVQEVADGSAAPWRGYEPAVVVLEGASGVWHLLSHLDPEAIGRWAEPKRWPVTGAPRLTALGKRVREGDQLGQIGGYGHTHWEVRRSKLAGGAQAINPGDWLRAHAPQYDPTWVHQLASAPHVTPADVEAGLVPSSTGGDWLLWVGLWYLLERRR